MLLLLLLFPAAWAYCPESCNCGDGAQRIYECKQGELGYTVQGLPNSLAEVICDETNINWTAIPFFPFSSNGTLESLRLINCELPSKFADVLASLGAVDVSSLRMERSPGELTAERLEGLKAVHTILMIGAENQTRIPYDVFDALPLLKSFNLQGGHLQLEENGGDPLLHPAAPAHPALRSVELAASDITHVPPGAFMKIKYVNKLYLWGNNIENITSESFRGLDHLETLDLTGNPLVTLPLRAFATPRLRIITLTATGSVHGVVHVETGAFDGLDQLEDILFKFGRGSLNFGPRALASLPALKKLTFDEQFVEPLPADLLENSTALEDLIIKGTNLEALPKGLFKSQKRVKRLDLSNNKIKALDFDIFWQLKEMEELNLDGNYIEELPGQLFSGLTKLKSMSANNNRLTFIAYDAFQGASFLEVLHLNDNRLTLKPKEEPTNQPETEEEKTYSYQNLIYQSPFSSLVNLKELSLEGNHISEIFIDWQRVLIFNLLKLNLSRNNFTELTAADIQFLSDVVTVDLRHNKITTVSVTDLNINLPDEPKSEMNSSILLDDNPFRCDCEIFTFAKRLHGTKRLTAEPKLDVGNAKCTFPPSLEGTPVKDVPPSLLTCPLRPRDCPDYCTCNNRPATTSLDLDCEREPSRYVYPDPKSHGRKYTYLRLRSMPLDVLPEHIVSLNLSGVGLTEAPDFLLQNIREMDLSHNHLTSAPLDLLRSNLTLNLAGNPFICDCPHFEDVFVLQRFRSQISDADKVACSTGESPWNVDAARLCDVRKASIIGGTLAALGIIAAVIAAFSYRYILEIKVFLFSRGWCQSLIKENELDKDLQYDAFVSFSEKDARWVSEQLLPKLEGAPNFFKLCVHYRDWVLGDMIPAQIARSVEQSRRTIVVLSESFLKSTWAQLEFRAANIRAQRERRARVLVIILEDIPECEEMDAELKAYLATNTYLKWGDRWFWEKLIYAMPHKKTGYPNNVLVNDPKLKKTGLNATLNAEGQIVNNVNLC